MTEQNKPKRKVIFLRSKDKRHNAGSQSLEGKDDTPKPRVSTSTSVEEIKGEDSVEKALKKYRVVETAQITYDIEVEANSEEEAKVKAEAAPLEFWDEYGQEVVKREVTQVGIWQPREDIIYGLRGPNNHTSQVRSILMKVKDLTPAQYDQLFEASKASEAEYNWFNKFTQRNSRDWLREMVHSSMCGEIYDDVEEFLVPVLKGMNELPNRNSKLDSDHPGNGIVYQHGTEKAKEVFFCIYNTTLAIVAEGDMPKKYYANATKAWTSVFGELTEKPTHGDPRRRSMYSPNNSDFGDIL